MNGLFSLLLRLCLFLFASAAVAQDVTLTSRDGSMVIEGAITSFDGEYYQIDSTYGELTLDATGVTCEGPGCPSVDDFVARIRVTGAEVVGQTLLPALIRAFEEEEGLTLHRISYTDNLFVLQLKDDAGQLIAEFFFDLGTASEGFEALETGTADIVLSAREITDAEAERLLAADVGDMREARRSRIIALDAVLPIVSPNSEVRAISAATLLGIMAGEIDNWIDISGDDAPINLILPAPDSSLGHVLRAQFGVDSYPEGVTIISDPDLLADLVLRDPFALGLTRMSEQGSARPLPLTGECGAEMAATELNIKTEDYPLPAPLFIYTPAQRLPRIARAFLKFLDGAAANRAVSRYGFVDQLISGIPLNAQGPRLALAIQQAGEEISLSDLQAVSSEMQRSDRLSLSFRFEPGSSNLDAQSRANVRRLAEILEAGEFDGQELLFAGFSDGEGAADANLTIALRRAEAVLTAVRDAAELMDEERVTLRAQGFGEALPIACDDSEWGRQSNRRVELWVHRP